MILCLMHILVKISKLLYKCVAFYIVNNLPAEARELSHGLYLSNIPAFIWLQITLPQERQKFQIRFVPLLF